ncbi:fungal protein [Schizosaccharomyces cryophilus OY26]|uniref:Fungal protein n=1 Tax=Schizosaccharomyces cryophilus (strain OY26 / ATCC MYA-4695 / CBS 11777 / NBRC 106824 / NRRL Y48691) TaxID=653667 RepID=S9W209_SCHCR|nr:uncharacterized protein SPOG_03977 [Schizosaccharomyces cryophilus OY26]EPY54083.1 fungal protein [Schizosaccharomyces cryophilus OY26]
MAGKFSKKSSGYGGYGRPAREDPRVTNLYDEDVDPDEPSSGYFEEEDIGAERTSGYETRSHGAAKDYGIENVLGDEGYEDEDALDTGDFAQEESQRGKNLGNVRGGYKATLHNPNISGDAKKHAQQVLDELDDETQDY